jgi:rhamnosyltransferase
MISIIIRTLNESKHLGELLVKIKRQKFAGTTETIVVDSGSTDATLRIANDYGCRIVHIKKEDFSFGRSLNVGCLEASGDTLVFVSGHCLPAGENWLQRLVAPILSGEADYTYGGQRAGTESKLSEKMLLQKYFPEKGGPSQGEFFCNNANAALASNIWNEYRFDESLTGLEDLDLAKRLVAGGGTVTYVASAPVFHLHDESWNQVRWRYEREALALQAIMPEVHVGGLSALLYFLRALAHDLANAAKNKMFFSKFWEVVFFRTMQYWGVYMGNKKHRKASATLRKNYFYPK